MGLTGFYPLIQKHGKYEPEVLNINDFKGKVVALDGDSLMYKALFGSTSGTNISAVQVASKIIEWLNLADSQGIRTIFVTTGGEPPKEKTRTLGKRKLRRDAQIEQTHDLKIELENIENDIVTCRKKRRITTNKTNYIETHENSLSVLSVNQIDLSHRIRKLTDNSRHINSKMSREVSKILEDKGFICLRARSEADFLLVLLSEQYICDYVATEDGDILLSGAKNIVRNFISVLYSCENIVNVFNRDNILKALDLNSNQLLQLGCLMNCDYQKGIFKMGAVTSWKNIKRFGDIKSFLCSTKFINSKLCIPDNETVENFCLKTERTIEIFKWRPDEPDMDTFRKKLLCTEGTIKETN